MTCPRFAICLPWIRNPRYSGGGVQNTIRFGNLLREYAETRFVSYEAKEDGVDFLPDVAAELERDGWVAVITWGPHIERLLSEYYGRLRLLYYQQSIDWGFALPPDVPVMAMSKTLHLNAQERWPATPSFYLPMALENFCRNQHRDRDLDVLVVTRKQHPYVLKTLVPMLQGRCKLQVLDHFVPRSELYGLFNRTKVYLYAFAPMASSASRDGWRITEGIATQVLEASVCGCTPVSDIRGGHVDFVEPWVHGYRLMTHSPAWDVEQILHAVHTYPQPGTDEYAERLVGHYGEDAWRQRVPGLLAFLESFYRFTQVHRPDSRLMMNPSPPTLYDRVRAQIHRAKRRFLRGKSRG